MNKARWIVDKADRRGMSDGFSWQFDQRSNLGVMIEKMDQNISDSWMSTKDRIRWFSSLPSWMTTTRCIRVLTDGQRIRAWFDIHANAQAHAMTNDYMKMRGCVWVPTDTRFPLMGKGQVVDPARIHRASVSPTSGTRNRPISRQPPYPPKAPSSCISINRDQDYEQPINHLTHPKHHHHSSVSQTTRTMKRQAIKALKHYRY